MKGWLNMYAIFLKKSIDARWLPIAKSQQVENIKQARKYRKLDIALHDYHYCVANYPNFGWSLRNLKTNDSVVNNLLSLIDK